MKIACLPVEEEEKEFLFMFGSYREFSIYLDGLNKYAAKLPKKYRIELEQMIIRLDASSRTIGDNVTTSLMELDALKFFKIITSAIASVSLTE